MIANRFNPLGRRIRKPYAYRVEYIESYNGANGVDGIGMASQYLRIPITPKLTDEAYIRVSKWRGRDSNSAVSNSALFGGGYAFRNKYYGTYYREVWFGSYSKLIDINDFYLDNTEKPIEFYIGNSSARLVGSNGDSLSVSVSSTDEPQTDRILIGAVYTSSNKSISYQTKMRLHEFWMKRDGKFLVHLLPVVDWDGRPACYDEVSGQLFYNAGSQSYEYLIGPRI